MSFRAMYLTILGVCFSIVSCSQQEIVPESVLASDQPIYNDLSTKENTQQESWDYNVVNGMTGMEMQDQFVTNPRFSNQILNDFDSMIIPVQENITSVDSPSFEPWEIDISYVASEPSLSGDCSKSEEFDTTLSKEKLQTQEREAPDTAEDSDCTTFSPTPSSSSTPQISPSPATSNNTKSCQTTLQGCKCKTDWVFIYNGVAQSYSGCANPDNDLYSPWCIVDSTCPPDAIHGRVQNESGELTPFGRCSPDCDLGSQEVKSGGSLEGECYRTVAGCTCERAWYFDGRQFGGCNNPDGDLLGDWCTVVPGSCLNEVTGGTFMNAVTNETSEGESWDYCIRECT
eukprot:TRINITY_DN4219_c0_g1_i14.p1 TRINITY_DN4219_c0_g1~~TRINITY_DN4219_c0_g1_i14.p1  ORF type:complete len:343 (-),score=50.45 TRINITY_DN4219_c0_g1_i14:1969-2997(-)